MARIHIALLALGLASCPPATAQLIPQGLSVALDGVHLYVSPFSVGNLSLPPAALPASVPSVLGLRPVTVVGTPTAGSELGGLFRNWTRIDDVFHMGFTRVVFLAGREKGGAPSEIVAMPLETGPDGYVPPSGPYFLEQSTGRLFPVYRLYPDSAGAFSESLLQRPDGSFQALAAHVASSASLTVGVPSRLYYTPTAKRPLAGVRVGIKDIFALRGVKNSCGSRAWHELYGAADRTASSMQRLVDAGAVIVGQQKLSQFANGERPTVDWVDYHAPWNPRGDGYQDPSSSSSGAGAAMASYPWLDLSVGSDTGGSIRGPAAAAGVFGNRPTHGLVGLDGVLPLSPALDTAGFLLRDARLWDAANRALFADNYTSLVAAGRARYPRKIYTLGLPAANSTSQGAVLVHGFVRRLRHFVGCGRVEALGLADEWERTRPAAATGATLDELLGLAYGVLITKQQTALVRDPFYRDYAAAHNGRRPFVNPQARVRWAYGDGLPESALEEAQRNKTLFSGWFNEQVLPRAAGDECSSSLVVFVDGAAAGTTYRDEYLTAPSSPPLGFGSSRISVFAGVPNSVFPLGDEAAASRVSGREEGYPVAVNVLAARGCDGLLARLAADLVEAGILREPRTGRTVGGGVFGAD
ncbi:hypothetical protein RB595_010580 [Gaeumannomyces hyphopodioides]